MLNALAERPRVSVLGPVRVEGRDGTLVEPPGTLAKALVAVLAAAPHDAGGTVGVETIIDELWGEAPPRNAKAALQTLVSRLRAVAADGLVRFLPGGYALDVAPGELDLSAAQLAAESGGSTADAAALDRALALWHGEPGTDLGGAPVAELLAGRSAAARAALLERRAALRAAAGDHDGAAADLRLLLDGAPVNEHLVAARLRELAASGRRADAIAEFAAFRAVLAEELGASPSAELVALNAELLRAEEPTSRAPRLRIGVRAAPNELIGRGGDLDAIEQGLAHHRLVTILGTGGLGKTRLAQEVAARSTAPTVVVVELASVRSDDDVTLALASTLGIREAGSSQRIAETAIRPDVRSRIMQQLAERPALLVLDNCEQVVEGAATWTADLLAAVPSLRVLATSRSPLAIGAEQVYPLEPLAADGTSAAPGPAAQLFIERARAARPGAALPLDIVTRLCDRLDGLPLAIELAAARVRSMTVEQIEARLENRFALLADGDRSAPERQRTLAAVIGWSWALLTDDERRALARLSWFADGFGLEAADRVTGVADAVWLLDGLITQSMLSMTETSDRGEPRYRMLETVREYGQDRLGERGETAEVSRAMRDWAVSFARDRLDEVDHGGQLHALDSLRVEQDNLVALLRGALDDRDGAAVLGIFATLGYYWTVRSAHSEILAFSAPVLDATRGTAADAPVPAATLSYVLIAGTNLAIGSPIGVRALARLRRVAARELPVEPWVAALSSFLFAYPDLPRAIDGLREMAFAQDPRTALLGSIIQAQYDENAGDPVSARVHAARANQLSSVTNDVWAQAMSSMMLAQLASQSADPQEALRWTGVAREGLELLGAEQDLLQLEWMVSGSLLAAGRLEEARLGLDRMVDDSRSTSDGLELRAIAQLGLAELARLEGRPDDALVHARALVADLGTARGPSAPWYLLSLSTLLAGASADWPGGEVAGWADSLRRRLTAMLRARPGFTDFPVLGTVAAGWGAWAMRQPAAELRERGLELLALGEQLHARQDLPALHLADRFAEAERRAGVDAVRLARDTAASCSPGERVERARELLATPVRRTA